MSDLTAEALVAARRRDRERMAAVLHDEIAGGLTAAGLTLDLLAMDVPEPLVERIREASETFGGEVGISAWNGFAMARFCAQDAARLRADMMTVLGRASGVPLPRLWLN